MSEIRRDEPRLAEDVNADAISFALLAENLQPGYLASEGWHKLSSKPEATDLIHATLELSAAQFPSAGGDKEAIRLDAALRMGVVLAAEALLSQSEGINSTSANPKQ